MDQKKLILYSAISVIAYFAFWNILGFLVGDLSGGFGRFIQLMGGTLAGIIQAVCFGILIYCLIDLTHQRRSIKNQYKGFEYKVLPSEENLVISPQEVNKIKLDIVYLEKQGVNNEINDFIKKACTQYRNENSITETLHVLESHINNKKEVKDSVLENIRYGVGANMSLGFIGTLIGLSTAIGKSYLSKTDEGLEELTSYLYTAFDTTLMALIFGIIINYVYHQYISELDSFYAQAKSYIVENLISKIYAQ